MRWVRLVTLARLAMEEMLVMWVMGESEELMEESGFPACHLPWSPEVVKLLQEVLSLSLMRCLDLPPGWMTVFAWVDGCYICWCRFET